jgi:pterin-4a-carbinolamine dehydratase
VGRPPTLVKTYDFRVRADRDRFVVGLLIECANVDHDAALNITELSVVVTLATHDLQKITDIDRELARTFDVLFKEIAYTPDDGDTDEGRLGQSGFAGDDA